MIDEPRIHEYGDDANVHKKVSLEFGEVDEGFAAAISFAKTPFSMRAIRICRWSSMRRSLTLTRTTS